MLESKLIANDRRPPDHSPKTNSAKQQRLMLTALILLVIALVSVLYQDRDFWFPDERQTEAIPQQNGPAVTATAITVQHDPASPKVHRKPGTRLPIAEPVVQHDGTPAITATRTVLPPLEVEVIAGEAHRMLRPGSNSVQIDLERGSSPSRATPSTSVDPEPVAANVIDAAEHVEVSSEAADLVTHSVTPGYPMLARQMKVQGSVILQAVIGRDGLIQDLHVISGPPILARAAQEAVKQWHFKPHYVGPEPVETQAKITVNFTISTN
jgi:TonB family protein